MPQPLPDSARERLAARARRLAAIRRRVIVATLAAFALAWGVIAFDGSMGVTTTASTQASRDGASASSSSSSSDDATSSSSSSSSGDSSAAVTTTQS